MLFCLIPKELRKELRPEPLLRLCPLGALAAVLPALLLLLAIPKFVVALLLPVAVLILAALVADDTGVDGDAAAVLPAEKATGLYIAHRGAMLFN